MRKSLTEMLQEKDRIPKMKNSFDELSGKSSMAEGYDHDLSKDYRYDTKV